MENRERMIEIAKQMMGIPEDKNLPKGLHYRLCCAYGKVEKTGGILLSRQAIAILIEAWEIIEQHERIYHK